MFTHSATAHGKAPPAALFDRTYLFAVQKDSTALAIAYFHDSCQRLQVVEGLTAEQRGLLLRFITSVSRAPLGGFRHMNPPLTIHKARRMA